MTGWIIYCEENRKKNEWFINQLTEEAEVRGICLKLIIAERLSFGIKYGSGAVFYGGEEQRLPDFVINRSIFPYLSCYFENLNIRVFNSYKVSEICNDKRKTHLFFKDLPAMETYFYDRRFFSGDICLKYPCVVKPADGHGGNGVCMVKSREELINTVNKYATNEFLVQKAASETGRDLRVYVLAGKVVAAALRSSESDFRSNFSLGGSAKLYKLPEKELKMVTNITSRLEFDYAGIDFIFDGGKMVLNEIEDVVGARMLYSLTDIEVHKMYIDHIINCVYRYR